MKYTTHKHQPWGIIALLMLAIPLNSLAQRDDALPPCQSIWEEYSSHEDNSIVRSNPLARVVHTQYNEPSTGMTLHTFFIKDLFNSTSMVFSTYFNATSSNDYSVSINDMELYGSECFFCGTITYPYFEPLSNNYISKGIVGHFTTTSFIYGASLLVFAIVPQTSQLTRLAVNKPDDGGIIKINTIGILDDYNTACLAEINYPPSLAWNATLNYIPDQSKILFSDILSTRDSTILLAQYKCANNISYGNSGYDFSHQIILLDRFTRNGCYSDCNSVPLHYMAHYFFPDNESYNFHYNKAPMALCNVQDNHFGAAFGVKNNFDNISGIRYFSFPNIWQYDSSIFCKTGEHPRLKDLDYSPTYNKVFTLSWDDEYNNSVVNIFSMGNAIHPVTRLSGSGIELNSLSMRGLTTYLDITSHRVSNSLFHLLSQRVDALSYTTCFNKGILNYSVFPEKRAALLVANWKAMYIEKDIQWETAEITPELKISVDTICKKCHND